MPPWPGMIDPVSCIFSSVTHCSANRQLLALFVPALTLASRFMAFEANFERVRWGTGTELPFLHFMSPRLCAKQKLRETAAYINLFAAKSLKPPNRQADSHRKWRSQPTWVQTIQDESTTSRPRSNEYQMYPNVASLIAFVTRNGCFAE